MQHSAFQQPNTEAMERLLERHPCDVTGVVLRLAWCEGLTRDEISSLTWEQVDFAAELLRLPDRAVPMDENTVRCLRQWNERYAELSPYVAISEKRKNRLAPQSLSRLVRFALDEEGQEGVRLQDLRLDFVRRQLEVHDWPYVLRISGLSVTTYRAGLAQLRDADAPTDPPPKDDDGDEFKLWKVMSAEGNSPAGLALRLSHQVGLQSGEIVALTWEQIDFDTGLTRLATREVTLPAALRRALAEVCAARSSEDDPHVLLTPRTRKPITSARLSTMVRTALIRGGIEDLSLTDFRRDTALEEQKKLLLDYAAKNGEIARGDAVRLLGVSGGIAYSRLTSLAEDGKLVRVNSKYYPAEHVIPPERQSEAIRAYIMENGPVYCQEIAELLHIGKRPTARILKRMVANGELVLLRRTKRYTIPGAERPAAAARG